MSDPAPPRVEALPDVAAPLRFPSPVQLFEGRAGRFRDLAPGHAIGEYLDLLARLASAQAHACRLMPASPEGPLPAGPAPLATWTWQRSPAWRHALDAILGEMKIIPTPAETAEAVVHLSGITNLEREALASTVLAGTAGDAELAPAVFVGAALQVYWTSLAAMMAGSDLVPDDPTSGCPVCGSPPVAGIVLGDHKLRYLICGLCGVQWHLTRVVCSHCRATGGLSYFKIDGGAPGINAEACAGCGTYLKLFYLEQTPLSEPVADDVASLALDLMMSEAGYSRAGGNCFLAAPGGRAPVGGA